MRFRHLKLDVVDPYLQIRMSADSLDCRFVSLLARGAADPFLERVLRSYYQVYIIKPCGFGHVLHDGKMSDVQGIE
jgi:hypothetical protein